MSRRGGIATLVLLGTGLLLGLVAWGWPAVVVPAEPSTPAARGSAAARPAVAAPTQARGTRVPMRVPKVVAGIAMGDGSFLPPLNGVTVADGIPAVRRSPQLPPPGPVVAKIVDRSGQEWWEHADGSQTSCSFASVTDAQGVTRRIVSTQHGAATPRQR